MLERIVDRIQGRLDALNLKASEASKKAGLSKDAIRNMQRAVKSGKRDGVSTRTILALAPVLQTTSAWLISGDNDEHASNSAALPKLGHRPTSIVARAAALADEVATQQKVEVTQAEWNELFTLFYSRMRSDAE